MIKTITVHLGKGGIIKCKHIPISIERRRDIPGFFLLNQGDCLFVSVDLENRDPPHPRKLHFLYRLKQNTHDPSICIYDM